MVLPHGITCEHRDTLHCTRQWVVSLDKREAQEACAANICNIGPCTGQIRIKCTLIVLILHFELHGITTLPCDLRGIKIYPANALLVLALVCVLVKLCPAVSETSKWKDEKRDEMGMRKEKAPSQDEMYSRIKMVHAQVTLCLLHGPLCLCKVVASSWHPQGHDAATLYRLPMERTMWGRSRSVHWWSVVWSGRYGEAWYKKNLYTCHGIRSFSVIHSEFKTHENIFFKLVHHTQATHHLLRFEPMHYQDTYIVFGVWWRPKLAKQHLHKFSMTTFTSPV